MSFLTDRGPAQVSKIHALVRAVLPDDLSVNGSRCEHPPRLARAAIVATVAEEAARVGTGSEKRDGLSGSSGHADDAGIAVALPSLDVPTGRGNNHPFVRVDPPVRRLSRPD